MKKNDLRDALSEINKDYIAESDDFKSVAADFRNEKKRQNRVIVSLLCLALVCVGVIGISQSGLLKRDLQAVEKESSLISSDELETDVTESATNEHAATPEQSASTDNSIADAPKLYYSELVKNTEMPELSGYENISASLDITAFDESMLKDSAGFIEGEVVDMWVNHYEYATASDKFEPNGRLYHNTSTVAYKIRVDRVLSGDFSVGDVITVEDYYFILDSIVSRNKGGSYVIPIGKGEGKLFESDEIVSGSNILESSFYTLYQFQPQIEKVSGGYVVPSGWKTLITDECSEIIIDVEEAEMLFPGSLYFVPDSIFNERMSLILQST